VHNQRRSPLPRRRKRRSASLRLQPRGVAWRILSERTDPFRGSRETAATGASQPAFQGASDTVAGSVRSAARAALPTSRATARILRNVMISDCKASTAALRSESSRSARDKASSRFASFSSADASAATNSSVRRDISDRASSCSASEARDDANASHPAARASTALSRSLTVIAARIFRRSN